MATTITIPADILKYQESIGDLGAQLKTSLQQAQNDVTNLQNGTSASFASGITAGTTRTQAGATPLTKLINRVDTGTAPSAGSTLGDGVALPASAAGSEVVVVNNTANPIQVYGVNGGSDQINGLSGGSGSSGGGGVPVAPGDIAYFFCAAAGGWQFEAGLGCVGFLPTEVACDGISAAGANQGGATQLVAAINTVATVSAGQGCALMASAQGLSVVVQNNGANPLTIYGKNGGSDTINGIAGSTGLQIHPGTVAVFNCTAPGAWTMQSVSPIMAALNTVTSADSNITLTAAQVTGAVAAVDVQVTGGVALTAGRQLILPTVATLVAALHAPTVGTSYRLRVCNFQGGAFAFTVTTNTGWTLTGTTFTVAQNAWREFVVTLTSLTTATLKPVAVGTFS